MSAVIPIAREKNSRRSVAPDHRRVAAIDIGSNSIRQIVADVSPEGTIQVVDEMKAAPRLATGLSKTGALSESSIQAAIEAIERMATLARQLGAERIDAVATSAVRDASNASTFVAQIQRVTGLRVRVLDGDEEARLSFRSAVAHFDMGMGRTVVIDIGGGSLELALSAEGVIERLNSLPFGAIRLTEEFLHDGVTSKAVKKLRRSRERGHSQGNPAARLARRAADRLGRHVHQPRRDVSVAAGNPHRAIGARRAHSARRARAHSRTCSSI